MSPARRPKEPRKLIQVLSHNGEHELIFRVSRRTRIFLVVCFLSLVFSGGGAGLGAVVDTVRLLIESGVLAP